MPSCFPPQKWAGHPIANDPCYGGELHFGNPEAKRRAEENPAGEGWKGVPREVGSPQGPQEGKSDSGALGQQPGAPGAPSASKDSAQASGGEAVAGRDNEEDKAAAVAAVAVPAGDVEGQREGEDDEAFMVSRRRARRQSVGKQVERTTCGGKAVHTRDTGAVLTAVWRDAAMGSRRRQMVKR